MSKTRKILCVVLAAALVFALAIPAFAAGASRPENATDAQNYTQEWSLEAYPLDEEDPTSESWKGFADYFGNGYYVVDVYLKTNYEVGAVEFEFETTGEIEIIDAVEYEYPYACEVSFNENRIVVVPNSSSLEPAEILDDKGKAVGIVTVFVSGNGTMKIKNEPKTETNGDGTLIAVRLAPANIVTGDMYYGQKVVSVGDAVTIGTPANPQLVVKAGNTTVKIDTNKTLGDSYNGTIYGFVATSFRLVSYITDALEVTDGGSMVIKDRNGNVVTAGTTTQKNLGTGATVEVYSGANGTGTKLGTYVIVIFGDCNGDGRINGQDVTIVYNCAGASGKDDPNYLADNSLYRMAANTKNNTGAQLHTVNGQDITPVYNGSVDQSAMATKMFALTGYYA